MFSGTAPADHEGPLSSLALVDFEVSLDEYLMVVVEPFFMKILR
jgi:hypothetical protein